MKPLHEPAGDGLAEQQSAVAAMTPRLHGMVSRTDPAQVAAEVLRLNDAVRAGVQGRIAPGSHPQDYPRTTVRMRDAAPRGGPSPAPAHDSLARASALIRAGTVSAETLTRQALARAAQVQPTLNPFIAIWGERALEQARERDRELAQGHWRGPLHGIPLAHKDCFTRAGLPMTVGSKVFPDTPGDTDAAVLRRLETAGAVDLGPLNLSEMVSGPTGQNPHWGDCCNAHDPARVAGGSSSGSAVAVASGAVFGSLGSDTGGSIRLPASMNGIYGLKPTYGLVSRQGCFPRAWSLDCIGPLARSPLDCGLLLQAVAGHDADDSSSLDAPVPDYAATIGGGAAGTRVALLDGLDPYDDAIAAALDAYMQRAAAVFGPSGRARFDDLAACYAMGDVIAKVEGATMHGEWMRRAPQRYSQAVYSRTEPGLHIPAVRYAEALLARGKLLEAWLAGPMARADVLVCPTVPIQVPTRAEADMEGQGRVFGVVAAITRLTRAFNYLGLPVLSVPIGKDANGMPIGAQLIGRPLSEARLLAVAHALAEAAA
ncbi:amidase [Bordetella bronchialis]|uniref:amidase n=1 Tax=Bordetella bronchialis TaxID=463025 RepID=UPI003D084589